MYKQDLALNNPQGLISPKAQPTIYTQHLKCFFPFCHL